MAVVIVLLVSWLCFRTAGALGVSALASWASSVPYALAAMFIFTGTAHFTKMKNDLGRMVPAMFPRPELVIFVTGALEFAGAAGLLFPRLRAAAALSLIVLLICMFPANVKAARERLNLGGRPATPLLLRVPMQLLFIGLLWWSAAR